MRGYTELKGGMRGCLTTTSASEVSASSPGVDQGTPYAFAISFRYASTRVGDGVPTVILEVTCCL